MKEILTLRSLLPGEGAKLVDCIRRCYGSTYVDPSLYDAGVLDAQLASGKRHSVVALTREAEVVGHLGLVIRAIGDTTADAGLTMVDPRHRGSGLAHRLSAELGRVVMQIGLVGLHDYPVTVHGGTQRLGTEHAVGVGLLLDNMPGDVAFNEMGDESTGRATHSLVRYMAVRPGPEREVYIPEVYARFARSCYERSGLTRTIQTHAEESGADAQHREPELEVVHEPRRSLVRIAIPFLAAARIEVGAAVSARIPAQGATQVDLPLSDPGAPDVAMELRRKGSFFGALLPEFRRGSVRRESGSSRGTTVGQKSCAVRFASLERLRTGSRIYG